MEYKVESTELTDIADAIREKSGSQDALTFPDEFVSGIRGIPTGSTSIVADEYDDQSTYDVGDYVVYENALYKCNTAITTAEEWTSAHWDEVTVMEEVETKADTDGSYEDMSVGNLMSTQFVENKEPYLFRRTGNGKNIDGSEKAFIDKIIGGTVAWNQLVPNSGSVSVTVPSGHKYFSNIGGTKAIAISNGSAISATGGTDNIVDLTALFGSAEIADYVYSLEQTTSGSGVAWLKSHGFIDGSYRAYDSGSLHSVKTSAHRTSGKNLLENTGTAMTNRGITATFNEDGTVTLSGTNDGSSYSSFIVNGAFQTESGVKYILNGAVSSQVMLRDITAAVSDVGNGGSFTGDGTAHQIVIRVLANTAISGSVTVKPMIRLASVSDATYEPYHINSYPLDSDLELRGLFKLDANNNLYAEGDVYESSGAVTVYSTMETVDASRISNNGTLPYGGLQVLYNPLESKKYGTQAKPYHGLLSNLFTPSGTSSGGEVNGRPTNGYIYFNMPSSVTTIELARQWFIDNPTQVLYELATPTTETAQPYASPQVVSPFGTEEYIDTRDVPIPVGHETRYMANLREKIEDLPWDLSMIAPIENGATASQAYAQGKYFLKDNQFCKALTSIASGATFTLNTNYAVTTVANELYTALHS